MQTKFIVVWWPLLTYKLHLLLDFNATIENFIPWICSKFAYQAPTSLMITPIVFFLTRKVWRNFPYFSALKLNFPISSAHTLFLFARSWIPQDNRWITAQMELQILCKPPMSGYAAELQSGLTKNSGFWIWIFKKDEISA